MRHGSRLRSPLQLKNRSRSRQAAQGTSVERRGVVSADTPAPGAGHSGAAGSSTGNARSIPLLVSLSPAEPAIVTATRHTETGGFSGPIDEKQLAIWRHGYDRVLNSPQYKRVCKALWDASGCAKCGKAIAPDERITWKRILVPGFLGSDEVKAPCCDICVGEDPYYLLTSKVCGHCGRPVRLKPRKYQRRFWCSNRCSQRWYNAHRIPRYKPRVICGCCGSDFKPARRDAAFCSSACRQRAYRQRKAAP